MGQFDPGLRQQWITFSWEDMKKWGLDFDSIYVPLFVNGNHWISLCINFALRTVEVFDCYDHNNRRRVNAFTITIPWILKKIHTKSYGKNYICLHILSYMSWCRLDSINHSLIAECMRSKTWICGTMTTFNMRVTWLQLFYRKQHLIQYSLTELRSMSLHSYVLIL